MELVEQRNMKVATACRLFGHCRQAFYQSKADIEAEVNRDKIILDNVREIRDEDPGIGGYKLWLMLTELYGRELIPGRDSFFTLLRRHQLMLPPRKARHTTNSNHRYRKWKNQVKDIVLTSANQLWVSDITYIQLANGDVAYLHLVTDAYSRKIVGWVLADTLRAALSIQALQMAIDQAIECARDTIGRYIQFYNNRRPHMSIGYKTPSKVHLEQGIQQKMWKKRIYTSKKKDS